VYRQAWRWPSRKKPTCSWCGDRADEGASCADPIQANANSIWENTTAEAEHIIRCWYGSYFSYIVSITEFLPPITCRKFFPNSITRADDHHEIHWGLQSLISLDHKSASSSCISSSWSLSGWRQCGPSTHHSPKKASEGHHPHGINTPPISPLASSSQHQFFKRLSSLQDVMQVLWGMFLDQTYSHLLRQSTTEENNQGYKPSPDLPRTSSTHPNALRTSCHSEMEIHSGRSESVMATTNVSNPRSVILVPVDELVG